MEDSHVFRGSLVTRPRIFRVVRLWSKPGKAAQLQDRAEQVTRAVRAAHPDVQFRSYLARTFVHNAVEILAATVWDTPEDMRRVLGNASSAARPFGEETYGDALERWEVTTYEVFFPLPPLEDGEAAAT